ncbi:hypothetical protein R3P38DRAFT_2781417 [Favolaschia claudopus]|uniref:Uncharacterized protein n=1 Tax=Favolaschia claudopus TaxID=2862362 RepID=A0AAW0B3X2_9AGAR
MKAKKGSKWTLGREGNALCSRRAIVSIADHRHVPSAPISRTNFTTATRPLPVAKGSSTGQPKCESRPPIVGVGEDSVDWRQLAGLREIVLAHWIDKEGFMREMKALRVVQLEENVLA